MRKAESFISEVFPYIIRLSRTHFFSDDLTPKADTERPTTNILYSNNIQENGDHGDGGMSCVGDGILHMYVYGTYARAYVRTYTTTAVYALLILHILLLQCYSIYMK